MKKIFTFLLLIFAVNLSIGQSFVKVEKRVEQAHRGILDISGDIQSNNFYTPGTTMDLMFTLNLASPDQEYVDMVTLTFPTGMTPTTGSDPFPGNSDGQEAEALNALAGQVISWGDNDNDYGGVNSPGNYDFFVTVMIDSSLTGDQSIGYVISGDEYSGTIHEFSGDVVVKVEPTAPELVTSITGTVSEYYALPLSQATITPTGSVFNQGADLAEAVNVDLTITGGYAESMALPNPMTNGETANVSFPDFTFPAEGTYTFNYNANYASDADPSNNVMTKDIEVGNTLSRDNGDIIGNIGIGSEGGELGNVFTITAQDTITSVEFILNTENNQGSTISVKIREFGTEPGDIIGSSLAYTITDEALHSVDIFPAVVLAPGTYYIGLLEGADNVQLAYTSTPFIPSSAWGYFSDAWNNLGGLGFEHTYYLRGVFDDVQTIENDIKLSSTSFGGTVVEGNVTIAGTVQNLSTVNTLTDFDVQYTADAGTPSSTYTVSGISVAPGAFYTFSHDVQYAAAEGAHNIEVVVSNPNGQTDEDLSNNSSSATLIAVKEVFPQVVVGEEATGTWCGWCVRGHVGLKDMAHNYTDGSWIGIAVHNEDPMEDTEYDTAIGEFIDGYPSGVINRYSEEVDPGDFETAYQAVIQNIPVGKVDISSATIDMDTRLITVDAASIFALNIDAAADYNLSLIVLEDSVTGTESGYAQVNYYSSNAISIVDWEGIDWSTLGNPIPAADMVYDHVGRYIVGGFDGVAGSVPTAVTYNTPNNFQFTTTLPAEYNENHIKVVALLLDNATGHIVNAAEEHVEFLVSNTEIGDANAISVFPNPTAGELFIQAEAGSFVTVFDILGRKVFSTDMPSATKTIDLSNFDNGSYFVEVLTNNTIFSKKVVLTK